MASNETVACKQVNFINDTLAQCDFVKHNDYCQDADGYLNYVEILYCNFAGHLTYLGVFVYSLWIAVLFVALAVSTDDFFCPNLATISKTLR